MNIWITPTGCGSLLTVLVSVVTSVTCLRCSELDKSLVNCDCASELINCTNTGFKNADGLQKAGTSELSTEVKTIVFTHNQVKHIPRNLLGFNRHDELETLDLSHNGIKTIDPGAFHRMPNLKTLILDYNEWDFINTSLTPRLFNHSRLTTLSLSSAFATRSNESYTAEVLKLLANIFKNSTMDSLLELRMSKNGLYGVPSEFFEPTPNLQRLDLSHNLFYRLTANLINLRDLKHLNLSWNQMNVIEEELLSNISYLYHNGSLKSVRLQGNPINCNCLGRNFYDWLNGEVGQNVVIDRQHITCNDAPTDRMVNKLVIELDPDSLTCLTSKRNPSYIALGIVVGLVGVVALVILYLNRGIFINKYRGCKETLNREFYFHMSAFYRSAFTS